MKIYSATTAIPLTFQPVTAPGSDGLLVLAGAEVTAIARNDAATSFHLNYQDEAGETWDATVGLFQVELGSIVATLNEG